VLSMEKMGYDGKVQPVSSELRLCLNIMSFQEKKNCDTKNTIVYDNTYFAGIIASAVFSIVLDKMWIEYGQVT
jgi:hypothetical protein